ncbi:unnamed protein product [Symbiodinium sp. CCMP2592]|nr:unnamed protein product [Symbiodinium sp. CCMP2592]
MIDTRPEKVLWAKEVLRHLSTRTLDEQIDAVTGPLESIRHGLQALLSVLPTYAEGALCSAKLFDVLTTVRCTVESGGLKGDEELQTIEMGLPTYPQERYEPMSQRIQLRGPAMIRRDISQGLDAWDSCATILWCPAVSACHWHMSILMTASKDVLAFVESVQ